MKFCEGKEGSSEFPSPTQWCCRPSQEEQLSALHYLLWKLTQGFQQWQTNPAEPKKHNHRSLGVAALKRGNKWTNKKSGGLSGLVLLACRVLMAALSELLRHLISGSWKDVWVKKVKLQIFSVSLQSSEIFPSALYSFWFQSFNQGE